MKSLLIALFYVGSFFSTKAQPTDVPRDVLTSFESAFTGAKEVQWTVTEDLYKAEFVFNNRMITAYYSMEGEYLGVSRGLTLFQLPMALQNSIKKDYPKYWITELVEFSKDNLTEYYITLENADFRLILKSSEMYWATYKKESK